MIVSGPAPLAKLRRLIRQPIANMPIYSRILTLTRDPRAVNEDSELCLEGFPRSGNSLLESLIRLNSPSLKIAHHTHSIGQIKRAISLDVPTFVVIRDPVDACSSLVVHDPKSFSLETALNEYEDFYTRVLELMPRISIVHYSKLASDPSGICKSIFSSMRLPISDFIVESSRIYASIDELGSERRGTPASHEPYSPMAPADVRQLYLDNLTSAKQLILQPVYDRSLSRCRTLWSHFHRTAS